MITVDGRIFDTDLRWKYWCKEHGIIDPFKEIREHDAYQHHIKINASGNEIFVWERDDSPEYRAWYEDWEKRRDEYLRQQHTFRAWDCHFWMDWERFEKFFQNESYTDISIYLPCDCANRQCSMRCVYFLGECPRQEEELKSPVNGLEGRYEI